MGYVAEKVAVGQVFLRILPFSIVTIIPSVFYIRILFIKHGRCIIVPNGRVVTRTLQNTESLCIIKYFTQDKYYKINMAGYSMK